MQWYERSKSRGKCNNYDNQGKAVDHCNRHVNGQSDGHER